MEVSGWRVWEKGLGGGGGVPGVSRDRRSLATEREDVRVENVSSVEGNGEGRMTGSYDEVRMTGSYDGCTTRVRDLGVCFEFCRGRPITRHGAGWTGISVHDSTGKPRTDQFNDREEMTVGAVPTLPRPGPVGRTLPSPAIPPVSSTLCAALETIVLDSINLQLFRMIRSCLPAWSLSNVRKNLHRSSVPNHHSGRGRWGREHSAQSSWEPPNAGWRIPSRVAAANSPLLLSTFDD